MTEPFSLQSIVSTALTAVVHGLPDRAESILLLIISRVTKGLTAS